MIQQLHTQDNGHTVLGFVMAADNLVIHSFLSESLNAMRWYTRFWVVTCKGEGEGRKEGKKRKREEGGVKKQKKEGGGHKGEKKREGGGRGHKETGTNQLM